MLIGPWIERLVSDLAKEETRMISQQQDGCLEVLTFEGSDEFMPVTLHIEENTFVRHLDSVGTQSPDTWPGLDTTTVGYRLFLVHLDAVLRFKVIRGSEVRIVDDALRVEPERPVRRETPVSGAYWSSERPS